MTESSRARPESAFAHLMQQQPPQEKKKTPRHDTTRRNLSARSRIHPASPDCATASCGYGPFSQLGGGRRAATGTCYGCNNNYNKRQDAAAAAVRSSRLRWVCYAACGLAWSPRTGLDSSEPRASQKRHDAHPRANASTSETARFRVTGDGTRSTERVSRIGTWDGGW